MMRRGRLRWHGHVDRKDDGDYVKSFTRLVLEREVPIGRRRKTWQNTVSADILKIDSRDVHDQKKWRALGRRKVSPASALKRRRRMHISTCLVMCVCACVFRCILHASVCLGAFCMSIQSAGSRREQENNNNNNK